MEPLSPSRYESGRPMLLGGVRQWHPFSAEGSGIPEQWRQFESLGQIPGQLGANAYGVMCGHNAEGFEYMCAVEVNNFDELPGQLGRMRLKAQDYAVFEHRGPVSTIRETWEGIFDWLANSASDQSAHKPDFEVYGETFDPSTGLGGAEIWISVVRKA